MPKLKGFSNARFKKHFNVINLSDLAILAEKGITTIDTAVLLENRIIRKKTLPVKLLGNGELKTAVNLVVTTASASAKESVEKAGGTIEFK